MGKLTLEKTYEQCLLVVGQMNCGLWINILSDSVFSFSPKERCAFRNNGNCHDWVIMRYHDYENTMSTVSVFLNKSKEHAWELSSTYAWFNLSFPASYLCWQILDLTGICNQWMESECNASAGSVCSLPHQCRHLRHEGSLAVCRHGILSILLAYWGSLELLY